MTREGTVLHDLQLLENDLQNMERASENIRGLADQADMRKFVHAIRMLYKSKMYMFEAGQKALNRIRYKGAVEERVDDKLHKIFEDIARGAEFSPTQIANLLEKSLDLFETELTMQIRYQPVAGGNNFVGISSHVGVRKKLFLELQTVLEKDQMGSVLDASALTRFRTRVAGLAHKRYPDLLGYLQSFDKLVQEFNTTLHNFFVITENLDMVKGVPIKSYRTFLGFIKIPSKDKKRSFTLTKRDELKIKALQGLVYRMHDTTIKSLRERQRQIMAELKQIKIEEAELRGGFKKYFKSGKTRLKLLRAA